MGDRAALPVSSARVRSQGDDQGGVEAAVHVPLPGGDQPITGLDVFQRAGLAVRLATFKVPGLAGHVQFDGLAVLVRDADHVAVDSNDLPGNMRPAEVDSRRIEFAVARFEPYADMAVDFDRGPAGGLVAAADDLGLVGAHDEVPATVPGPAGLEGERGDAGGPQRPDLSVADDGGVADVVGVNPTAWVAVLHHVSGTQPEDGREGAGIVSHDVGVVGPGAAPSPGAPSGYGGSPQAVPIPTDRLAQAKPRNVDPVRSDP